MYLTFNIHVYYTGILQCGEFSKSLICLKCSESKVCVEYIRGDISIRALSCIFALRLKRDTFLFYEILFGSKQTFLHNSNMLYVPSYLKTPCNLKRGSLP